MVLALLLPWGTMMGAANAKTQSLTSSLVAELTALRRDPETPARLGAESRLLYYLSQHAEDADARKRYRDEGKRLAKRALEENPDEPAALLWWTAHRGSEASPLNPFKAVRIAREVESSLQRLRNVAPDYDSAAADRVLGRLYQVAPAVVSVGDMKKAGRHLASAMSRFPEFPGNQLFYAEWLEATGKCREAVELAKRVLASKQLEVYPFDAAKWREDASKLLRDAGDC